MPTLQDYRDAVSRDAEKGYLEDLMRVTAGNVKKACDLAGLSKSRLYALLKQHGLK